MIIMLINPNPKRATLLSTKGSINASDKLHSEVGYMEVKVCGYVCKKLLLIWCSIDE
jgi:uncharacterized protein YfeS